MDRQPYPVGDLDLGQAVQVTKLPEGDINWSRFESVTVSTTAVGLTFGLKSNADHAFVTVESTQVRFRIDGGDPTSTVGHVLEAGDKLELENKGELNRVKFIRTTGADATLRVTYGRRIMK